MPVEIDIEIELIFHLLRQLIEIGTYVNTYQAFHKPQGDMKGNILENQNWVPSRQIWGLWRLGLLD